MKVRLLFLLDRLLHRLAVPRHFWWPICDEVDIALGVPDTPENFPRRHGYVRLQHVGSGSSAYPENVRCHFCSRPVSEWQWPCLLVKASG